MFDFPPKSVLWELTRSCNRDCRHCYLRDYRIHTSELAPAAKLQVLDHLRNAPVQFIRFSGGEPRLATGFTELIAKADEYGIPYSLITNCKDVPDSFVEWLSSLQHLAALIVSFEHIMQSLHDSVRGTDSWRETVDFLGRIPANRSFRVEANFTLNAMNVQVPPTSVVAAIKKLGADKVNFYPLIGRASLDSQLGYRPSDLIAFLVELYSTCDTETVSSFPLRPLAMHSLNRIAGRTLAPVQQFGCKAAGTDFLIEPNGRVLPCMLAAMLGDSQRYGGFLNLEALSRIRERTEFCSFINFKMSDQVRDEEFCHTCRFFMKECRPCRYRSFAGLPENTDFLCHWAADVAAVSSM